MSRDLLWVEKYRPTKIADCVLSGEMKATFSKFVEDKFVPNLLLTGGPGIGKTTVARAMLNECDFDYTVINGSMNGNIDTLRVDIKNFASTRSFTGARKYVILDEADYLNPQSTQPALRNFMEEYSKNCGFILTCNFKNRIIDPLHSRCSVIEFKLPNSEKGKIAGQFMKRTEEILAAEGIEYDKAVVAELIKKHFPDWRRVLNELQRYSAVGKIDSGILASFSDEKFETLIAALKARKFSDMRKWVGENSDIEPSVIYRKLFDASVKYVKDSSIPQLVVTLNDYAYKGAFVADQEVNLVACMTEVMAEVEFL